MNLTKSQYHQVVGALVCSGRKDLANTMIKSHCGEPGCPCDKCGKSPCECNKTEGESNDAILKYFLYPDSDRSVPKSSHLKIEMYPRIRVLLDYGTPIAAFKGEIMYLNKDNYSHTTSKSQSWLKRSYSTSKTKEVTEPELNKIIQSA